jgi:Flp pilus assembly protein TadD
MKADSKNVKQFVLQHADHMKPEEMAAHLGTKLRKVKKIIDSNKHHLIRKTVPDKGGAKQNLCWREWIVWMLGLLALGGLIYSNSFHVPFLMDDRTSIVQNYFIRSFNRIGWYWQNEPTKLLAYLTYAFNYQLGGLQVFSYHVVNLVIHLCGAVCVFGIVFELFKTPQMAKDPCSQSFGTQGRSQGFFALGAALIFMVHPVQTEAVTYIVQRNTSLATLFYYLTFYFYIRGRIHKSAWSYGLSVVLGFAAMYTKQIAFTLPLSLGLFEFCFMDSNGKGRSSLGKTFLLLLPAFAALVVAYFKIYHHAVAATGFASQIQETREISRSAYFLTQLSVLCTYLRLLFIPVGQNLDYDYPIATGFWQFPTYACGFLLLAVMGAGILLWRKGHRLAAFGIFWFFLTLSIESSVIPIRDVIFEHRLYLPMLGFSVFLGWLVLQLVRGDWRQFRYVLLGVVLVFGGMTFMRNQVWGSEESLWTDVVRKSPHKARGYDNLGVVLQGKGNLLRAREYFEKAIELSPDAIEGYVNLGFLFEQQKDYEKAIAQYEKAISLHPTVPEPFINLGRLYGTTGNYEKATEYFNAALKMDPNSVKAINNLAVIANRRGETEKEIEYYLRAIEIDPTYKVAYRNLGVAYGVRGDNASAVKYLEKAVRLAPRDPDARYNLGVAYLKAQQLDAARDQMNQLHALGDREFSEQLRNVIEKAGA